jgi:hypothetical protein
MRDGTPTTCNSWLEELSHKTMRNTKSGRKMPENKDFQKELIND